MRKLLTTATAALWWLCLIVQPAFAQTTCQKWCVDTSTGFGGTYCGDTAAAAYGALLSAYNTAAPSCTPRVAQRQSVNSPTSEIWGYYQATACDGTPGPFPGQDGASPKSVSLQTVDPAQCNSCGAKADQTAVMNFTVCFSRQATSDDPNFKCATPATQLPVGGNACDGTCKMRLGTTVQAWGSQAPTSSGLYRYSLDMNTSWTGDMCNELDSALNPAPSNVPPCSGSVGTVNGKPYCAGTAANPVAGDQPVDTPLPPTQGNPTAGEKPASGPGSGVGGESRTPAVGGGGPEGGPIQAGNGGYTGTVPTPTPGQEQAACGAPGQPPCRIDETGTPRDGATRLDGAVTAVDTTKQGVLDAITAHKDLQAPAWSWTFQLPSGCTPYVMESYDLTIDMCQWQPIIHDLMALVWIGATIWGCIALVGRTLGGPA